jgi:branched-chain amino acid transport system ATP-binding protein
MLELREVEVAYGNIRALKGISLTVAEGELVTLIGANGAGKSTTLKAVSGLLRPIAGTIQYHGQPLDHLPTHQIVALGISHCPEGRHMFGGLTVAENLRLGAVQRHDQEGIGRDIGHIYEMFPVLRKRSAQLAGTLSGGEQQMLAIGRALMSRPKLLLLDEPSLGLAPILVGEIFDTIRQLKREGSTILLVEQNARVALDIADRAYVLETGRVTLQGLASELKHNPQVEHTYLGT